MKRNYQAGLAAVVGVLGAAAAGASAQPLYALQGNISPSLYTLDLAGTVLNSAAVTGHEALFGGFAADLNGDLWSIDGYNDGESDRTFRIDPVTGAGTVVGPTGFNWNFRTVHVHPGTGVLYGARDNQYFTIDTSTGAATLIANMSGAGLGQITAMAINSAGQAYITNIAGVDLFSLDLATGATTLIGTIGGPNDWYNDLAFDENDVLYGARLNGGVYQIDTSSATETFLFFGNYTGLAFDLGGGTGSCYANCDESTNTPILNVADFTCFLQRFAAGESYANCDQSTAAPVLNVADFTCFLQEFAAGCP